jgi:concentrative nucleoside transporter, CNT family
MRSILYSLFLFVVLSVYPARGGFGQDTVKRINSQNITDSLPTHSAVVRNSNTNKKYSLSKESLAPHFKLSSLLRGFFGVLAFISIAFVLSNNRKLISWKLVITGLFAQIVLAFLILYFAPIRYLFELCGKGFVKLLDFTRVGSEFIFGGLLNVKSIGFVFAFEVLPIIVFVAALMSLFFYFGIIQRIVYWLALLLSKSFRLSGPESLDVAGTIFLGQNEAPLMVKNYLNGMNRSEIMLVMTAGMSMMAGSVLAAYINFLGGDDPVQKLLFAKHLLAASVMAAPGAVVMAKILVPQDQPVNQDVFLPKHSAGRNVFDALSSGTSDGIKLAVTVAGMLIVFLALIAMGNYILFKIGLLTHLNEAILSISAGKYKGLSLQFLLGYAFSPLIWLTGICKQDVTLVGRLLGEKIILTEFIGYLSLADLKASGAFLQERTIVMATYILCGFANFASIGIQVGGIGSLAPGIRHLLSINAMKALIGGTLTSLMSATIVGMILG